MSLLEKFGHPAERRTAEVVSGPLPIIRVYFAGQEFNVTANFSHVGPNFSDVVSDRGDLHKADGQTC